MNNFSQSCQIHLIDKSLRFFLRLIKHAQIPRIILDSFNLHHIFLAEYNLFSKVLSFSPDFSTKLISLRFPFLTFFQPPDISIVTFFRDYSMCFVTFFRVERQVGLPRPLNGSLQHFGYCFFHFFCIYRLCNMLIHTDRNCFSSIFFKGIRCHSYDWNLCLFFI